MSPNPIWPCLEKDKIRTQIGAGRGLGQTLPSQPQQKPVLHTPGSWAPRTVGKCISTAETIQPVVLRGGSPAPPCTGVHTRVHTHTLPQASCSSSCKRNSTGTAGEFSLRILSKELLCTRERTPLGSRTLRLQRTGSERKPLSCILSGKPLEQGFSLLVCQLRGLGWTSSNSPNDF